MHTHYAWPVWVYRLTHAHTHTYRHTYIHMCSRCTCISAWKLIVPPSIPYDWIHKHYCGLRPIWWGQKIGLRRTLNQYIFLFSCRFDSWSIQSDSYRVKISTWPTCLEDLDQAIDPMCTTIMWWGDDPGGIIDAQVPMRTIEEEEEQQMLIALQNSWMQTFLWQLIALQKSRKEWREHETGGSDRAGIDLGWIKRRSCVYMYVCILHGDIESLLLAGSNAYIHPHKHAHIHACMHTYMHACMHAYIHTCIHTCTQTCTHACMHAYIHTCMHACILVHYHVVMRVCT
jgi:hypothetical protein